MSRVARFLGLLFGIFSLLLSSTSALSFEDVMPHQAAPGGEFTIRIISQRYKTSCTGGILTNAPEVYLGGRLIPTWSCLEDGNGIFIKATIPANIGLEGYQHLSLKIKGEYEGESLDSWLNFQILPNYRGINNWQAYELVGLFPAGYKDNDILNSLRKALSILQEKSPRSFELLEYNSKFEAFKLIIDDSTRYKDVSNCYKDIVKITGMSEKTLGIIIEANRLFGQSAGIKLAPNYMNSGMNFMSTDSSSYPSTFPVLATLNQNSLTSEPTSNNSALYILDSESQDHKKDDFKNSKGESIGHGKIVRAVVEMQIDSKITQSRQICISDLCKVDLVYKFLCEIIDNKQKNPERNIVVNMSFTTPYDVDLLRNVLQAADQKNIWLVAAYGNQDRCAKLEKYGFCNAYPADWRTPIKAYSTSFAHLISVGAEGSGMYGRAYYERVFSTTPKFSHTSDMKSYYGPTVRAKEPYGDSSGTSFAAPVISGAVMRKVVRCSSYKLMDYTFKPEKKFELNKYLSPPC